MSEQCALGPDCPVHLGNPCEHSVGKCVHCMQTVYPAAGPWHKWPEERPTSFEEAYLVEIVDAKGVWHILTGLHDMTEFAEGASVRWAEILPSVKP